MKNFTNYIIIKYKIIFSFIMLIIIFGNFNTNSFAKDEIVTLPLSQWENMLNEIESEKKSPPPQYKYSSIDRKISGTFRKGLFQGKLTARFEVLSNQGHTRIPVIDGTASLNNIFINGKKTSLLRENNMYTVGINRPGQYTITLKFSLGKEQDRYDRRLQFKLPEAGATGLKITIPERNIESKLANGVLISAYNTGNSTQITGNLNAAGNVNLSWTRRVTHEARKKATTETTINTLFTVHESLVTGFMVCNVNITKGEIDRYDLKIPENIEIIKVEGDAVLQWQSDITNGKKLSVLLRYLIAESTTIKIFFQFPVVDKKTTLSMPAPLNSKLVTGATGILGKAGLSVQVPEHEKAQKLELRDLPQTLTALTDNPLLYGFTFKEIPEIKLKITRLQSLKLTDTLIDSLEASTVIIEDGLENTKIKLRIRNNTRQYLKMIMPPNAILTTSLIDGIPIRPALIKKENSNILHFPLLQSEKIGKNRTDTHRVSFGETLSDIANKHFSDPLKWKLILEYNGHTLKDAFDLREGQKLIIPYNKGVQVKEKSFLIEISYKNKRQSDLGSFGFHKANLPLMDIDIMKINWFIYFPKSYQPISISTNLIQYSNIRYNIFQRLQQFLNKIFIQKAWAGGSKARYENIFIKRKALYKSNFGKQIQDSMVLSNFPLTGKRYKFRSNLINKNKSTSISIIYASLWINKVMHYLAFISAFLTTILLLLKYQNKKTLLYGGINLIILIIIANFFLGIHRRIIWGIDIALLTIILQIKYKSIKNKVNQIFEQDWSPPTIKNFYKLFNLIIPIIIILIINTVPLLLSTIIMFTLFFWWRKNINSHTTEKEATHA